MTLSAAVRASPPGIDAEIVTDASADTVCVVIVNDAAVKPGPIVIDEGTAAALGLLLVNETTSPVPLAATLSVTVPTTVCPP
jgi:hypothetical protein